MSYKDISNLVRGAMYFSSVPPPGEVTLKNRFPFTLTLSSPLTADNVIELYSQFSRSAPYVATDTKWTHLIPQWRFEDEDGNIIESITADTTAVYSSGVPVGSVGTATFYYIDDLPTEQNSPLLIWATLDVSELQVDESNANIPGYANSKVVAGVPYSINQQNPDHLEITRNGKDDINYIKWTNMEFPYFITIKGSLSGCGFDGEFPTIFDYPSSNDLGNMYEINRVIDGISATDITWNPTNSYFQRYDTDNFYVGGFTKGSVISQASSDSTFLSAGVTVKYQDSYREIPFVWISNPEERTINRVSLPLSLTQDAIDALAFNAPMMLALTALSETPFDSPYITEIDPTNTWSFSGYGGIFGMAVDPCYDVWAADAEMDYIYKFNVMGELVSSIALNDTTNISGVSAGCTPASISLDSEQNVYVSLFDSVSVLRFDTNGNFQYRIAPSTFSLDIEGNEDTMPTMVAADLDDNIWVAYANNTNSKLTKYLVNSVSAVEDVTVSLDASATPIDLNIKGDDNSVWITNAYSHQNISGSVQNYDTSGNLINSYEYRQPAFLTLDRANGVWFTFGLNNVGHIPSGGSPVTFSVSSGNLSTALQYTDYNDTVLGGIGADARGYVWIINSEENLVYRLSATTEFANLTSSLRTIEITPNTVDTNWAIVGPGTGYTTYSDPEHKSAQAYGDWTGYDWIRKYQPYNPDALDTVIENITGTSNEFTIKSFENSNVIRRFNESWDAAGQMREYALSDHVYAYYNLFENYLKNMVGGNESEDQHIGRYSYEKIANFVANHSDIDEANLKQVYSLAQEADVPIDDYNFAYPVDIRRIMDIVSISHQNLWGSRCKCKENFTPNARGVCSNCNHYHCSNLGTQFSTQSYIVTANVPFLVRRRYLDDSIEILNPVTYNLLSSYPLSSTSNISWLNSSEYGDYNFYHYLPHFCDEQVEGVINWDDVYTTLNESNSSIEEWYGEWGIVEQMFDFFLHKGLDLENG